MKREGEGEAWHVDQLPLKKQGREVEGGRGGQRGGQGRRKENRWLRERKEEQVEHK